MKPSSPTELYSEQDNFTTSPNLEEELQTRSQSCDRTSALLADINSLAETNSVAETLELTARLLAEVEIAVTRLTLDRGGFVTVWRTSEAPARETGTQATDLSVSARAEATSLEAHYRGEMNPLMKRAAGEILKAAIQNTLTRLDAREVRGNTPKTSHAKEGVSSSFTGSASLTTEEITKVLRHLAQEGDIILPVEVCILRRGETFKQWAARVKQLSIEATCRTNGTRTMREAADRLGVSHSSLKSHLYRARCAS
jgi:hypothetical protein